MATWQMTGSWSEVADGIGRLQAQSIQAAQERSRLQNRAEACFLGLLGGLFLCWAYWALGPPAQRAWAPQPEVVFYAYLVLAALLLLAIPILFGVAAARARLILDEDKLMAAARLLSLLQVDAARRSKVRLQLDLTALSKCPDPARPIYKSKGPKWGPWKYQRQSWLRIRWSLSRPGQRLHLKLTRLHREKTYSKRSGCRVKQFCRDRLALRLGWGLPAEDPPENFRRLPSGCLERAGTTQESYAGLVPPILHLLIWSCRQRPRG